jgi:hypothetical protein
MSSRPKVFISSTIYDFRDLRSCLRHYLLSLGFEPILSEYNDFSGPIEQNSYNTCMAAISSCKYFILLIGSRVGGLYDRSDRISITRHEYRLAYELLKTGQLKILTFVRRSLWDVKEDRKALIKYLEDDWRTEKELSDDEIDTIAMHPSQFITTAKTVFAFIDEVAKKDEMQAFEKVGGSRPIGNWIYQFHDFTEIVDALRTQLNISSSICEMVALSNVRREIISNLIILMNKVKNVIYSGNLFVKFLSNYNLEDLQSETEIPLKDFRTAFMYSLTGLASIQNLGTQYAHELAKSGQLQKLDYQSGTIQTTRIGEAILKMLDQVDHLKSIAEIIRPQRNNLIARFDQMPKTDDTVKVKISTQYLYSLGCAYNRHQNIITVSKAIVRAIDGDETLLTTMVLLPIIPSKKFADEIASETPNTAEIEAWVKSDS